MKFSKDPTQKWTGEEKQQPKKHLLRNTQMPTIFMRTVVTS